MTVFSSYNLNEQIISKEFHLIAVVMSYHFEVLYIHYSTDSTSCVTTVQFCNMSNKIKAAPQAAYLHET